MYQGPDLSAHNHSRTWMKLTQATRFLTIKLVRAEALSRACWSGRKYIELVRTVPVKVSDSYEIVSESDEKSFWIPRREVLNPTIKFLKTKFLNPTQKFLNPTKKFLNLTRRFLNPTKRVSESNAKVSDSYEIVSESDEKVSESHKESFWIQVSESSKVSESDFVPSRRASPPKI